MSGDKDNRLKRACVIGWPIGHSRSPLIHGHWLQRYGVQGEYSRQGVAPEDFDAFICNLANNGFAGANITIPYKERAFRLADEADEAARAIEAANTLWIDGSRIIASNTDVYGFLRNLDEQAPAWDTNASAKPVAILGAGGAARSVVRGVLDRGFEDIRLVNRSRERSEELARKFNVRIALYDWREYSAALNDCALLVNATSLGMTGAAPLNISTEGLRTNAVVCDIVYAPLETRLLQDARHRGFRCVDGLGMLLHQAVPGFETWFGVRPEVSEDLRKIIVRDIEGHSAVA